MLILMILCGIISIIMLITMGYTIITGQFHALPREIKIFLFYAVITLILYFIIRKNKPKKTKKKSPKDINMLQPVNNSDSIEEQNDYDQLKTKNPLPINSVSDAESVHQSDAISKKQVDEPLLVQRGIIAKEQYEQLQAEKEREQAEIIRYKEKFNRILESLPKAEIVLSGNKHKRNYSRYFETRKLYSNTKMKKFKTFIALDTETTGLDTKNDYIIQLSAIKFIDFEPAELWTTYIKPPKHIPSEATEINGITDQMVKDAPEFYQIINSFNEFIEDFPLITHYSVFHIDHLYMQGLDSLGCKMIFDTFVLSKSIAKDANSYNLQEICKNFGIHFDNAHNASSDCLACGLLFISLLKQKYGFSTTEDLRSRVIE